MVRSRASALVIILVLAAAACSGKGRSPQSTHFATVENGDVSSGAGGLRVDIFITGHHVNPPPAAHKVARGKQVGISVLSNISDQLDVHGYNKALNIQAGAKQLIVFTADKKGLFPVELRNSHLQLLQVRVT